MACISYSMGSSMKFHRGCPSKPSLVIHRQCNLGIAKISKLFSLEPLEWESPSVHAVCWSYDRKENWAPKANHPLPFVSPFDKQALIVRLESDLAQVLLAACRGELKNISLISWTPGSAMVVVMASNGYPGNYEKGSIIKNPEEAEHAAPSVKVFHAGTALDADGNYIATGGSVLGITAKGKGVDIFALKSEKTLTGFEDTVSSSYY